MNKTNYVVYKEIPCTMIMRVTITLDYSPQHPDQNSLDLHMTIIVTAGPSRVSRILDVWKMCVLDVIKRCCSSIDILHLFLYSLMKTQEETLKGNSYCMNDSN